MKTQETFNRIRRVVAAVAKASGLPAQITCPVAVWDNTNEMIGVSIESPKLMGAQKCMYAASFALTPAEYAKDASIEEKAKVAMDGIRLSVVLKVRQIKNSVKSTQSA